MSGLQTMTRRLRNRQTASVLAATAVVAAAVMTIGSADAAISFSGDVAADFTGSTVVTITDPGGIDVGMPASLAGRTSGNDVQDVRVHYDADQDRLYVGFNTYGIAGDVDGDGDPSGPASIPGGGKDSPEFGPLESFALVLDLDQDGIFDAIAGVSATGTLANFTVAEFAGGVPAAAAFGFGSPLPGNAGTLFASPSSTRPDLEFTIGSFSTLPRSSGADASPAFDVVAFVGSSSDGGIGEDFVPSADVPATVALATLGDRVWNDQDGDGLQDPTEVGIAGVLVKLIDATGTVVDTTTTDSDGLYKFTVPVGDYKVQFETPAGMIPSPPNVGSNDAVDSDAQPSSGTTDPITLDPGDVVDDVDAGFLVPAPAIDVEKLVNGDDADTAPGPDIAAGTTVTFTFRVTNTGNTTLSPVTVTDDVLGPVCTVASLAPAATTDCALTATAVVGNHVDTGTATGQPVDATGTPLGSTVTDSDPGHYVGRTAAIDVEKLVNGDDADTAPGPEVPGGSTVTFTFVVTNTGEYTLTTIMVSDDVLGPVCTIASLAPGASSTCTLTAPAVDGLHTNVVRASGIPITATGQPLPAVTDTDPGNYTGHTLRCLHPVTGPALWAGAVTSWDTGLVAPAGAVIEITNTDNGSSGQPHQQVFLDVGPERIGPSSADLTTTRLTVTVGGLIKVVHWSVVTGDVSSPNSVIPTICILE